MNVTPSASRKVRYRNPSGAASVSSSNTASTYFWFLLGRLGPGLVPDDVDVAHRTLPPLVDRSTEVRWLQPFPTDPAAVVSARTGMRLASIAALQHLPARQRVVLMLRDTSVGACPPPA
jgi:hypothetical protein